MAVGRAARVAGIGLEALGVRLDRGFVAVSPRMETSVTGLYAIGDVAGAPAARPQGHGRGSRGRRGDRRTRPAARRLRQRALLHLLPTPGRLDRPRPRPRPGKQGAR